MPPNKKSYSKLYREKNRAKLNEYKRIWQRNKRHEYRRLHPITPKQREITLTELSVLASYRQNQGITVREISKITEVSSERVRQVLHKNKLPLNKAPKRLPPVRKCQKCGKDYQNDNPKLCSRICLRLDPAGPIESWPEDRRRQHLAKLQNDYYHKVLKKNPEYIKRRDRRNHLYLAKQRKVCA